MKWRYFLIIIGCYLLNLNTILAQVRPNDDQQTALFLQLKKLAIQTPVTEIQVRKILEQLGHQYYSSNVVYKITGLLQQKLPESEFYERISRLIDRFDLHYEKSFTDFKISGQDNQDLGVTINNQDSNESLTQTNYSIIIPVLEDFQVTEDSAACEGSPEIGVDGNGNFVVVWEDRRNGDSENYIYCQIYNNNGEKRSENFRVNDGSGRHENPAIGVGIDGRFIIAWDNSSNIYYQQYYIDGKRILDNLQIIDNASSIMRYPAISVFNGGIFVLVWNDYRDGNDGIYCWRMTGTNFRINDSIGSGVWVTDICFKPNNFVVVWVDNRNKGFFDNPDIFCQRYDLGKLGSNFQVNDDISDNTRQGSPSVSIDNSRNFVVVWEDERNRGAWDIYCQRYESNGNKIGNNFKVNDYSSGDRDPKVSVDHEGNFIVVWEKFHDIYAQRYNKHGKAIGVNYRVNNDSGDNLQMEPDVQLVNNLIYYTWWDWRNGSQIFARVDSFNSLPSAPNLISPLDKSLIKNNQLTLSFTVPKDGDGDSLHFKVDIATDINFVNKITFESIVRKDGFNPLPPLKEGMDNCDFAILSPLEDGTYYWQVTAYDGIGYGRTSTVFRFTIDARPPDAPSNLLANGSNPSPWQYRNNTFKITWENPPDRHGISKYYYKLGEAPRDINDFLNQPIFDSQIGPQFTIQADDSGGQMLYLWLENGIGNKDHHNHASVLLQYYNQPFKIFSPSRYDTLKNVVTIVSSNFPDSIFNKYTTLLKYKPIDAPNWIEIEDTNWISRNPVICEWNSGLDSGDVSLKVLIQYQNATNWCEDIISPLYLRQKSDVMDCFISFPTEKDILTDSITIKGRATCDQFHSYYIYLSKMDGSEYTQFQSKYIDKKGNSDILEVVDSRSFIDGEYTLCLVINSQKKKSKFYSVLVHIDNSPPEPKIISPTSKKISCCTSIKGTLGEGDLTYASLWIWKTDGYDTLKIELDENVPILNWCWDNINLAEWEYTVQLSSTKTNGKTGVFTISYDVYIPELKPDTSLEISQEEFTLYIPPNGFLPGNICLEKKDIIGCKFDSSYIYSKGLEAEIHTEYEYEKEFFKTAILTIDFNGLDIEDTEQDKLIIYCYDNGSPKSVGGTVDKKNNKITSYIKKIGTYGLGISENGIDNQQSYKDFGLSCQPRVFSPGGREADSQTSITFILTEQGDVTIKIYNTAGRLIRFLQENKPMRYGEKVVVWDGRDDHRNICSTGLYIIALEAENKLATTTVVVMNK